MGRVGKVADIALFAGIGVPPLPGRHTEQSHIQNIRLAGVDQADLLAGQFRGDQIGLNGIGVDTVIDFCQVPLDVPTELFLFIFLEPLKLLDYIYRYRKTV